MKCFEDLTFCDDFMFCKVMVNPEVCRGVLEVILGRKIAEAKLVISTQESIQNAYAAKGVRLDVMADDESHTLFPQRFQAASLCLPGSTVFPVLSDLLVFPAPSLSAPPYPSKL